MQKGYKLLAKVVYNHGYFQNGLLRGLSAHPSVVTSNLMNKYGLLFKADVGGFTIYWNSNCILLGDISLDFDLMVEDEEFYNYTLLNDAAIKKLSAQDIIVNNSKAAAGSADFGNLKLSIKPDDEQNYIITFEAKSAYWRYLLAGENLTNLNLPVVINSATKVVFDQLPNLNLPNGAKALVFQSKIPIPLSDTHWEVYQLGQEYNVTDGNYSVVLKTLPYPDFSRVARHDGLKEIYEIYIY